MTPRPFRRVGVVNRGEPAMRFLRGARVWSLLHDAPLEVVAFYTDPDAGSAFVREADAEVALGPALVTAADGRRRSAYLDIPAMVARLVESGCDAVWPGWGFLSENPAFVDAVTAAGIVFIGPPAEAMRRLGDKIAAKRLAEANGVPVTPWSGGPVADAAEAKHHADRIGYPVLVKAVAGGGGRGIRVVTEASQLEAAFRSASDEARAAFGDASLLVEALLPEARHVEVQVLADAHGNVHAVGTRDCSMQRRHQKVIEEGPAPYLPAATLDGVCRSAVAVARASGYVNAGTAEFLVTPDGERFVFLEMNTRLQVEHPVTECTTGLDLVGAQIDVAMGARIDGVPATRGHAIEVRLNAEDPEQNFAPSAGRLHRFDLPHGPGVRVDAGFEAGGTVPTEFDSMLAKLIVTGATRDEALARLADALTRTTIAIEGGASNRALLLDLVRSPEFRRGPVTTRWLDRWVTERPTGLQRAGASVALVTGAIVEAEHVRRRHVVNFLREARGGGVPTSAPMPEPKGVRFSVDGVSVALEVATVGPRRYRVSDGTHAVDARFEFTDRSTGTLTLAGRRHRAVIVRNARELSIEVDGVAHRLRRASDGRVLAPLPAVVAGVDVKAGDVVTAGQRLATLEVMKMEFPVESPLDGVVTRVLVEPGVHVSAGDAVALVVAARDSMSVAATGLLKDVPSRKPAHDWGDPVAVLRGTLLGYELPAPAVTAALNALRDDTTLPLARLLDLLEVHVARECLFDRSALAEGTPAVDAFADYLRLPARDGFVDGFEPLLVRALASYEVRSLAVTAILESALLRIAQARRARDEHGVILLAALSALDRLADSGATARSARALFERLSTLEAVRSPRLADAAWTAAYLLCDRADHAGDVPLAPGPAIAEELTRLSQFELTWIPSATGARVALARARADHGDARLVGFVQLQRLPGPGEGLDRCYLEAVHTLRRVVSAPEYVGAKLGGARLVVAFHDALPTDRARFEEAARTLATPAAGLGLEVLVLRGTTPDGKRVAARWTAPSGHGGALAIGDPDPTPVRPVGPYERRVFDARRRGGFVPHELFRVLAREGADGPLPPGRFVEMDLDASGALVEVDRGRGENTANLLLGRIVNRYEPFADGLARVLIVGDPGRAMGSLAEPECRRIVAAFDLAEREGLPVEWIPVSSGAKIAMDSGTENLDWTARVLARIVHFTQRGGTVHVLVDGVCVGAQSYWNAEATMLQHCRGALLMTPRGAMLLTGKRALELAGSVSAEDNLAIGGFERVMGPNGEAQYFAADIVSAYRTLFRLYAFTHVMPGESAPRRLTTTDPVTRDFGTAPYEPAADGFARVGEIFDEVANPGRKRPFAIRPVLRAVLDQDHEPLERWAPMEGAESAVVYDGSLGGVPVTCIGVESRPVRRRGEAAPDGPSQWTAGTLFPLSSKKVARALNAASGVRPAVVLANLSGFDGSPESLRELQLEYGAEIGRAVVNFRGRLIFCVISRYHGGAYVVFSRALNAGLDAMALSGSFASVIGGAPAAEVVFPGMVRKRAAADREVAAARARLEVGSDAERAAALVRYEQALREATSRERAAVAKEFDAVHTVERARDVGSIGSIIGAAGLRAELARRVAG